MTFTMIDRYSGRFSSLILMFFLVASTFEDASASPVRKRKLIDTSSQQTQDNFGLTNPFGLEDDSMPFRFLDGSMSMRFRDLQGSMSMRFRDLQGSMSMRFRDLQGSMSMRFRFLELEDMFVPTEKRTNNNVPEVKPLINQGAGSGVIAQEFPVIVENNALPPADAVTDSNSAVEHVSASAELNNEDTISIEDREKTPDTTPNSSESTGSVDTTHDATRSNQPMDTLSFSEETATSKMSGDQNIKQDSSTSKGGIAVSAVGVVALVAAIASVFMVKRARSSASSTNNSLAEDNPDTSTDECVNFYA